MKTVTFPGSGFTGPIREMVSQGRNKPPKAQVSRGLYYGALWWAGANGKVTDDQDGQLTIRMAVNSGTQFTKVAENPKNILRMGGGQRSDSAIRSLLVTECPRLVDRDLDLTMQNKVKALLADRKASLGGLLHPQIAVSVVAHFMREFDGSAHKLEPEPLANLGELFGLPDNWVQIVRTEKAWLALPPELYAVVRDIWRGSQDVVLPALCDLSSPDGPMSTNGRLVGHCMVGSGQNLAYGNSKGDQGETPQWPIMLRAARMGAINLDSIRTMPPVVLSAADIRVLVGQARWLADRLKGPRANKWSIRLQELSTLTEHMVPLMSYSTTTDPNTHPEVRVIKTRLVSLRKDGLLEAVDGGFELRRRDIPKMRVVARLVEVCECGGPLWPVVVPNEIRRQADDTLPRSTGTPLEMRMCGMCGMLYMKSEFTLIGYRRATEDSESHLLRRYDATSRLAPGSRIMIPFSNGDLCPTCKADMVVPLLGSRRFIRESTGIAVCRCQSSGPHSVRLSDSRGDTKWIALHKDRYAAMIRVVSREIAELRRLDDRRVEALRSRNSGGNQGDLRRVWYDSRISTGLVEGAQVPSGPWETPKEEVTIPEIETNPSVPGGVVPKVWHRPSLQTVEDLYRCGLAKRTLREKLSRLAAGDKGLIFWNATTGLPPWIDESLQPEQRSEQQSERSEENPRTRSSFTEEVLNRVFSSMRDNWESPPPGGVYAPQQVPGPPGPPEWGPTEPPLPPELLAPNQEPNDEEAFPDDDEDEDDDD
jgi:hypothetical protein